MFVGRTLECLPQCRTLLAYLGPDSEVIGASNTSRAGTDIGPISMDLAEQCHDRHMLFSYVAYLEP